MSQVFAPSFGEGDPLSSTASRCGCSILRRQGRRVVAAFIGTAFVQDDANVGGGLRPQPSFVRRGLAHLPQIRFAIEVADLPGGKTAEPFKWVARVFRTVNFFILRLT
jgi:hypothetical protein